MPSDPPPRWLTTVVCLVVTAHVGIVAWVSYANSPNLDELAHLPAGISHWEFGQFELYRVNPPLVRMAAALPVLCTDAVHDWSGWDDRLYSRPEFWVGRSFIRNNGPDASRYFSLARLACLPFSVAGCLVCFRWASELYGWRSGLLSLLLYSSCPNLIAWGASITPDAASAATGLLAAWTYFRWLGVPTLRWAVIASAALGLAMLTKSTWVFLLLIFPLQWIAFRIICRPKPAEGGRPPAWHLVAILVVGVYIVNLGYGFERSFTRLGQFSFISRVLSGEDAPPQGGNRFAGTVYGMVPVPLPAAYVLGIDVQRYDFERGKWSYLRGEMKKGGWWWYYIYGILVKTPLGTLGLIAAAMLSAACSMRAIGRRRLVDDILLLAPAIFVITLVSSQTGFNRYVRYVLPVMPFLYVFTGRIACAVQGRKLLRAAVVGLLVFSVVESAAVLPHSMSFFNLTAGGPHGGPRHLLDANIDWAQDLIFLKRWHARHPAKRPLHVAYFGDWDVPPAAIGIDADQIPKQDLSRPGGVYLRPGWYAVSINYVHGYRYFDGDQPVYGYFARLVPVDYAGYSIAIYRVDQ
ncbi:MAG: glycosyltransferase family 39 protein [Planctomycetaceae bacterium]|nr:glycosyltransferase family 39 protein [Planctomycetaceae bacterium]